MRKRLLLLAAGTVSVLLAGAVTVYAYDSSRSERLAKGVSVGGVDIGGLEAREARVKLRRELARPLREPVVVEHGSSSLRLSPAKVRVRADVAGTVERALSKSREGNMISRTVRDVGGTEIDASLDLQIGISRRALRRFVHGVAHRLDRPARDASVQASGASVRRMPGRRGRAVERDRLERLLTAILTRPRADRRVTVPTRVTTPDRTEEELDERHPYFITVDRKRFRLHFYRRLRRVKSYPIAVGRVGLETPAGLYRIQNKAIDPAWNVPKRPWAGALAGRVIPPGPDNPIKARWMGFYDGAGVHGTDDTASLGTNASHGCIRMSIPEVKELYKQVPVGTPIYIG